MKTIKLFFATILVCSITSNAQITKGNWMMGGDANLSSSTTSLSDNSSSSNKTFSYEISPDFGYFVFNKFAIGTKGSLNYSKSKDDNGFGVYKSYNLGPFVRYYFLKEEKQVNIFLESAYNFDLDKNNKNTVFSSKVGTAIFLNSSVAFEISLKYSVSKYISQSDLISDSTTKGLTFGLGFQIHLEK